MAYLDVWSIDLDKCEVLLKGDFGLCDIEDDDGGTVVWAGPISIGSRFTPDRTATVHYAFYTEDRIDNLIPWEPMTDG